MCTGTVEVCQVSIGIDTHDPSENDDRAESLLAERPMETRRSRPAGRNVSGGFITRSVGAGVLNSKPKCGP